MKVFIGIVLYVSKQSSHCFCKLNHLHTQYSWQSQLFLMPADTYSMQCSLYISLSNTCLLLLHQDTEFAFEHERLPQVIADIKEIIKKDLRGVPGWGAHTRCLLPGTTGLQQALDNIHLVTCIKCWLVLRMRMKRT